VYVCNENQGDAHFLIIDLIQLYFFDMFWTSSSEILYQQLYGILSCIYISSLVADRMYLILKKYNFYCHILGILYYRLILSKFTNILWENVFAQTVVNMNIIYFFTYCHPSFFGPSAAVRHYSFTTPTHNFSLRFLSLCYCVALLYSAGLYSTT
jgi:hypothetical protein